VFAAQVHCILTPRMHDAAMFAIERARTERHVTLPEHLVAFDP